MYDFDALDYYELLGVSRSASADDIKRAYRRAMSKYHPDRYAGAPPDEQKYASERSQRINEAYRVLTDFAARSEYNLGIASSQRSPRGPAAPPPPPTSRDHQAELYAQAHAHLEAGRPLQAMAALRQLQSINPFYRDSAELMARTKAQLGSQPAAEEAPKSRRVVAVAGVGGVLATAALVAWFAGRSPQTQSPGVGGVRAGSGATATRVVGALATQAPTLAPTELPTEAPTLAPTSTVPPTIAPSPTSVPTATPEPAPSATPEPTAVPTVEQAGELVLSDGFANRSWAQVSGRGWSVGYAGNRYRVLAEPGFGTIWSYRTGPDGNRSYAVDVQVSGGAAGLMLRFGGEGAYLVVDVDPATGRYRVLRDVGSAERVLASDLSDAIVTGADAVNRVEARLRGDQLDVLINNRAITSVDVSGLPDNPRYGLVATAGDTTAEALFDNLDIRTLP
ncbi:MAG TPA: DnaJ domain-containing protein [Roseiflexaceae bacterium]|nr:DnaJ domain-containing protein [Roseiflexaceae bacterium]